VGRKKREKARKSKKIKIMEGKREANTMEKMAEEGSDKN